MIDWKAISSFHGRVNDPVLLTDGNMIAHGTWEQVPNPDVPPRWTTWEGTPFPHAYDKEWISAEGVYPFEPTHWAEAINAPA